VTAVTGPPLTAGGLDDIVSGIVNGIANGIAMLMPVPGSAAIATP
jgi:hypothetical protein